jgi:hypothetical protein
VYFIFAAHAVINVCIYEYMKEAAEIGEIKPLRIKFKISVAALCSIWIILNNKKASKTKPLIYTLS